MAHGSFSEESLSFGGGFVRCRNIVTNNPSEFDDAQPTVVVKAYGPGAVYNEAYCIEGLISRRGTTSVYRASDISWDRKVVLKVLTLAASPRTEEIERFEREGAILMSLSHPNVVSAFETGRGEDGSYFLAMEFLEGRTLADRLREEKRLSLDDVLRLFEPVADALDQVHARGVVHRDLKPANLFLPTSSTALMKILDFGLSSLSGGNRLTQTGDAIGSPNYMSPEQILAAKNAGPEADRYALAVCAYEALCNASPYGDLDRAQMLGAITHGRTIPISAVAPEFAAMDPVFARALAREPALRFPSASAFLSALRMSGDSPVPSGLSQPLDSHEFKTTASISDARTSTIHERPQFSAPRPNANAAVQAPVPAGRASWPWIVFGAALVLLVAAAAFYLIER